MTAVPAPEPTPAPGGNRSGLHIAYLNSHYPALSHTFIQREIEAIRSRGITVDTFSVRPCAPADLRSDSMRAAHATTHVLLDGDRKKWVRAHAGMLVRRPQVWFAGLAKGLRTGFPTAKSRLWQVFYFGEAVVLHQQMRRRGLRHVHVHHANVSADVARLCCFIGNRIDGPGTWTWSLTIHGSAEFEYKEQWDVSGKIRDTSAVSTISDFCRAQVMRLVEPKHWPKIAKVHMAVDPERFAPPEEPRGHDGPLRILTVGRLVELKGYPILIRSAATLRRRGIDTEIRIIGQGPDTDSLQRLIDDLGMSDRIHLVGALGEDDVAREYLWADVFVSTSFLEGLPVVLMEAMATGLPVIATQVGAVNELVTDGVSGRVLPPGRGDLLTEALAGMASDGDGRLAMGRAARRMVLSEFVPSVTGPQMTEFLHRVVEHDPRSGPLALESPQEGTDV